MTTLKSRSSHSPMLKTFFSMVFPTKFIRFQQNIRNPSRFFYLAVTCSMFWIEFLMLQVRSRSTAEHPTHRSSPKVFLKVRFTIFGGNRWFVRFSAENLQTDLMPSPESGLKIFGDTFVVHLTTSLPISVGVELADFEPKWSCFILKIFRKNLKV